MLPCVKRRPKERKARVPQNPLRAGARKSSKVSGRSSRSGQRQKHEVSPQAASIGLVKTPVRLAVFSHERPSTAAAAGRIGPVDIAPRLAVADILNGRLATDAFKSLMSAGYPKDELELDLCTFMPIGLNWSDQPKPQYSFGPIAKYSRRERKQKARKARDLAKWIAGNPMPNFLDLASTLETFAKEILKRPPKGHVMSTEDFFLLKFLAKVRDRTGTYRYTQVSVLVRMVLEAMFGKGLLKGNQREDQMWSEAHLKQLVHRRKIVLPLIYRKTASR